MNRSLSEGQLDIREKLTDAYIAVMLLIFPLFVGFSGYANLTLSKYLFFVIITLIWLVSLAFFSLRYRGAATVKMRVALPAVIFMLLCTASAVFSDYFPETIVGAGRYDGLITQLLYGFIFLGIATFAKPKEMHFALCGVSAGICCVIAIFQLFNINIFGLFPNDYSYYDAHIKYTGEFLGTMGNVDILSAYLCMCIPLFFSRLLSAEKLTQYLYIIPLVLSVSIITAASTAAGFAALAGWVLVCIPAMCGSLKALRRVLLLSPSLILPAALALSFDAGVAENVFHFEFTFSLITALLIALAFLAVCAGIALYALTRKKEETSPCAVIYLAAATAVMAALIFVWGYDGTEGTIYELSQILRGRFEDSFGTSRILIWRTVLESVSSAPLFGHGPDTLPLYVDINFSRFVPQTGKTLSTFVDNAHNVYLGHLSGIGIAGLISYLSIIAVSLSALRLPSHRSTALCCAVIAYLIHSFFGLGLCLVAPIFWLFLGLLASHHNIKFSEA